MKLRNWRPSSNLASAIGSVSSRAIAVLPRRLTARPRVPYKPSSTSLAVFLLAGVTVALLAWGLHTGLGRAATALDVATVSNQNGCNPCTWSHTVTSSGSNRILVVAITHNAGQFINGVTYAGETLTNVRTDSNGSFAETSIWYQVNPATGTNTVSVAFSAAPTASFFISYSLTGVDQASPIDANNGANGGGSSQPSVTVTTIAPGAWIIDAVYVRDTTLTMVAKSGRTQRMNAGTGPSGASSTLEATTATSYTMNWTKGANMQWAETVVSLKPSGQSFSESLSDAATVAQSVASALGFSRADTATLAESVLTGLPAADSALLSDSLSVVMGMSQSDLVGLGDTTLGTVTRGLVDVVGVLAPAATGLQFSEAANLVEVIQSSLSRAVSEPATLSDSLISALGIYWVDSANLVESVATGLPQSDTAAINESMAAALGFSRNDVSPIVHSVGMALGRGVSDAAILMESASIGLFPADTAGVIATLGMGLGFAPADSQALTDLIRVTLASGVLDTASLTENSATGLLATDAATISAVIARGFGYAVSDWAVLGESILTAASINVADSADIQDLVGYLLARSASETTNLSQWVGAALGLSQADWALLTESVQRAFLTGVTDYAILMESAALGLSTSDTAVLSDVLASGLMASDTANLVGLAQAALGLTATDTAGILEWIQWGFAYGFGDAALLAESVAAALGLSLGDGATLTQSLHTALGLSLGDSASLSEWVRRGFSYGIGDTAPLVDSVAAALGLSLGDGAALAQSLHTALALGLSDSASLSEWVQRGFGLGIGDAALLVDSVAAALGLSLGDSATLAQSLRTALALGLSDTASLSEWVQRGFGLGIGDAGLLADSVAAALGLSLGDSAALAQSLHTALALGLSDGASLSEWVQRGFSSGIGDAAPLVESLQTALALTTADSPSLSEWVQRGFGFGTGDSATLAQALQTALGLVAGDSAALSEWVQQGFGLGMSDAAPLVDSVAAALGISRTESAALKDSVNLAISPIIPGGSLLVDFVTLGQVRAIDTSMSELVSGSAAIGSTVQARPTEITASNLAIGKSDATGLAGLAATAFPLRESTALLETVAYSATSSPAGSADLSVQQAAVPGPVPADRNITYIIQVVNHGPSAATQVSLESIADSSLLLLAVSADSGTCDANLNVVTCNLGTLGINETVEVRIHARIPQVAGISSITNVVNVSAHQSDPVTDNNTSVLATLALPQAQGDGAQASDSYQGSPGHPEFDLLIQATQPELVDLEEILRSDRIMNIRVTDRPFGVINNADASGSFRLVLPASVVGPSSLQFSDFEAALGTLGLRHSGGRWSITLRLDDEITVNGEGTMVVGPLGSLELLVVPTTLVFEPHAPDAEMLDGGHPSVTEIGARFVVELKQLPMEVTLAATYAKDIAGLLEYASDKLALLAASLGAEGGAAAVQVAYAVKVDAAGAGGDVLGSNEVSFSVSRSWIEDEVSRGNRIVLAKFGRSGDPLLPPGDVTRGCRASSSGAPMVTCTAIFSGSQGGFSTFVLAAIEDGSGAIPVPYDPPATTPAPDPDVGTAPDAAKPDGSTGAKELPSSEQLEILPAGREPQPGAAPGPPPVQRESPGQAGRWGSGLLIAVPAILTLLVGISGLLLIRRFRAKPGEAGS